MKSNQPNQVRIIAGQWRGSQLPVETAEGLRPTPDRIRETVFNWIGDRCRNSRVLDCFAGSGALAFEAASRYANTVTMIEKNRRAFQSLKAQADKLSATNIAILNGDTLSIMPSLKTSYDMVFVDPPYALPKLRTAVLKQLAGQGNLHDEALIYLEWPVNESYALPASNFQWLRQKKTGQVHYAIAQWRRSR